MGGSRTKETVKDVNGRLLRGNETRKRWAEYLEELLNVQEDREADIVALWGVQVLVMGEENEREITVEELKRALNEMKGGKAPGMDGVRVEMLKEGGETVFCLLWLPLICEQSEISSLTALLSLGVQVGHLWCRKWL